MEERGGGGVLAVEELELDGGAAPLVPGDQVAELAEDVAAHLHHVLVARRSLEQIFSKTLRNPERGF